MNIGIITMHRVQNYGSALQAYALVAYLQKLGHHVETIDYVFPNSYHLKKAIPSLKGRIKLWIRETLRSFLVEPFLQRNHKFIVFRRAHLSLSKKEYKSKEYLKAYPPLVLIFILRGQTKSGMKVKYLMMIVFSVILLLKIKKSSHLVLV